MHLDTHAANPNFCDIMDTSEKSSVNMIKLDFEEVQPVCDPQVLEFPAVARAHLLEQVQELLKESGNTDPFDSAAWLDRWLVRPNYALGGVAPEQYLHTPAGVALLSNMIDAMESSSYF